MARSIFQKYFFWKIRKIYAIFRKIRKKFENFFTSQINEFGEDVTVLNGVLILKYLKINLKKISNE
jgi:hypothetical protein